MEQPNGALSGPGDFVVSFCHECDPDDDGLTCEMPIAGEKGTLRAEPHAIGTG